MRGWRIWKSNQKNAMDEQLMENSVMDAKIDPKVAMDLSMFKIGGWNELQPIVLKSDWRKSWRRIYRSCW